MIEIDSILDVEKHLDGIEAVIFDLDDTLYSEKEYVRSGYRKIAEYFRMPELEEQLWQVFLSGGKAIDEVLGLHGMMMYKDQALRVYREQQPDIHLYPGVKDMIARIRSNKKTGIITDGRPEGQRAKLEALHLFDSMDEIIITDELGGVEFRKPNPKAFVEMQHQLGVSFDKMCYIGDNIRKDFIVPDQLGMKSVYYKNKNGLY